MESSPEDVTLLLSELARGNQHAAEKLVPLVYEELKRLARCYMRRERPDHTPPGHRAGPRGLPKAGPATRRELAEPFAFLWYCSATDEKDPHRPRPRALEGETRRRQGSATLK